MTPQLEASNLVSPVVKAFKLLGDEWKEFMEIGLASYLYSQANKYYFTNTFIHRSEKVVFSDIYYPIKATYKKLTTNFYNLEAVLDEYNTITIVGSAGSGKTTLIKYIFLRSIELGERIPVIIELRNLNEYDGDFDKLISEKILNSRLKPSDTIFKRTLISGKFLFLLDGYDEIFSDKKQEINRQIEFFVDAYPENRFVLTTRPGSGIENFPRFYDFGVNPLENEDVSGFINKIVDNPERRSRIIEIVNNPRNSNYREFLRNPLLLSMFILAFESHPEIPGRKSAFYRNVFDTLYSRHDSVTKNSFPREKRTKLERDDFENILAIFSYMSLIEGKYSFTFEYLSDTLQKVKSFAKLDFAVADLVYDLHTSISIFVLDGFEYSFPHRSMQEYFTAMFVSRLSSDKKPKVYQNLAKALQESSNDNSFTFWSLCMELDEISFDKFFIIPNLIRISNVLDKQDDAEIMQAYQSLLGGDIFITQNNKDIRVYNTANFEFGFVSFCGVYDYAEVWHFAPNVGCEHRFVGLEKDRAKPFAVNITHSDVIQIFIDNGFPKIARKLKAEVDKKIKEIEETISNKERSIDALLSL